jgi:titin
MLFLFYTFKNLYIDIIISEAPLEFVRTLTDIELKENQTAKFECELNKSGETVKWFRNGEPINFNDSNITIKSDGKVHSLTLKKCDSSHAAKYTVKTTGPSSSGSLYVEGKSCFFLKI